jgi:hypothetical protein
MAEYLSPLDALSRQMGQTTRSSPLYNDWGIAARNERERKRAEELSVPKDIYDVPPYQPEPSKDDYIAQANAGLESANNFFDQLPQESAASQQVSAAPSAYETVVGNPWMERLGLNPPLRKVGPPAHPPVTAMEVANLGKTGIKGAYNLFRSGLRKPDKSNEQVIQGLIQAIRGGGRGYEL